MSSRWPLPPDAPEDGAVQDLLAGFACSPRPEPNESEVDCPAATLARTCAMSAIPRVY